MKEKIEYTPLVSNKEFNTKLCTCACDNICVQSLCWYGCAQCLWADNQVALGFEQEHSAPCWRMTWLTLLCPMYSNLLGLGPIGTISQCMGLITAAQSRSRFREENNITHDLCCACPYCAVCCFASDKGKQADCCQYTWCSQCALAQESRHIKAMKDGGDLPAPYHPPMNQYIQEQPSKAVH